MLGNIPERAHDADIGRFARQRIGRVASLPGCFVVDQQRAETPGTELAGEAQSGAGIHDPAGEDQGTLGIEIVRILKEERPALVESHFETLVDRDLRFVGFHLAEVRVQGRVQHEAVLKHEFGIQPDVFLRIVIEHRPVGRAGVQHIETARKGKRNELNVSAGRDVAHPPHDGGLIETAFDGRQVFRPMGLLAQPWNSPLEHDPPLLLFGIRKPQGPQGDGQFHHVAGILTPGVRIPDRLVGTIEIGLLGNFRPAPIHLNAPWRRREPVGRALVVEGIDEHAHRVVVTDVFPWRQVRPDQCRFAIEGQEYCVDIPVVVGDVNRRVVARRPTVIGFALHEPFDASHHRGDFR